MNNNEENLMSYGELVLSKDTYDIIRNSSCFDTEWYLGVYPDVKKSGIDPVVHYYFWGAFENRNPSSNFNTLKYCQNHNLRLDKTCYENPIVHYEKYLIELYQLVKLSPYFDKDWYLNHYDDVLQSKIDPIKHYIEFGWKEGRSPSLFINGASYLEHKSFLVEKDINPILYYEKYKIKEDYEIIKRSGTFDEEWYRSKYCLTCYDDPIMDYLNKGYRNNNKPNKYFDCEKGLSFEDCIKNLDIYLELCRNVIYQKRNDKDAYKICFKFTGGLGDLLIAANYLYLFMNKYLVSTSLDVYVCILLPLRKKNIFNFIFGNIKNIDYIYEEEIKNDDYYHRQFELFIELARFPYIKHCDYRATNYFSIELFGYVVGLDTFWKKYQNLMSSCAPLFDGTLNHLALLQGKKRYQQFDCINSFNASSFFYVKPLIMLDEKTCLESFHLKPNSYITIHRGIDSDHQSHSTKLWPFEYYTSVVSFIKSRYPDIKIVELGVSEERCPKFTGVDYYLPGKTNLDQLTILLKYASIHIDGEGGMVHLRHVTCGNPSIVIFGPTSDEVYGYSENCNLRSCFCSRSCEWISKDWNVKCSLGFSENVCMWKITPDMVDKCIVELLSGN